MEETKQVDLELRQENLMKILAVLLEAPPPERYLLLKATCDFFQIRLSWD